MKRITLLLSLSLILILSLHSQSEKYEVGLRITDLDHFGLIVKAKNKNGNFQRIRIASVKSQWSVANGQNTVISASSFAYGIEKRKKINENLEFIHGFEPTIDVTLFLRKNDSARATLGLGYVLGLQYNFNNKFSISIETIPSVQYGVALIGTQNNNANFVFDSNLAAVSIVHRFSYMN